MTNICFVCLGNSNNKICTICECYAHPKCWGEYLKNITELITYIYTDKVILSSPLYVKCPQCRQNNGNIKPVTRSDTKYARKMSLINYCINELINVQLSQSREEMVDIYKDMFEIVLQNKNLIKDENIFNDILKDNLKFLHKYFNWKSAKMYYNHIFDEQIV